MAANTASIIPMLRHSPAPAALNHRQTGWLLVGLSLALLALSLPQMTVGWMTAPPGLDHTKPASLASQEWDAFQKSMALLPQPRNARLLTEAWISESTTLTSRARGNLVSLAMQSVALAPADGRTWFNLAAVLEPEIFDPARMVLFDQALSLSYMTAPLSRGLILPRAQMVDRHWERLSLPLRQAWEDHVFSLWANAPTDLRALYLSLRPEAQRRIFVIIEQVPGESIKFNKFLDNPWVLPDPPQGQSQES